MALSEEAILQQINVLTSKTSENPEMVYKTIAALNKALNPEHFSGHNSTIVNAINKLASEVNLLNTAIVNLINKNNEVLSDIYTAENKENWADAKELMGVDNIIDGIRAILEGKKQDLILDLDIADNGKLLSVTINEVGQPEVKAVSIESLHVEVGAYDVAYLNRDFKELSSVGEALDKILEESRHPIDWDRIVGKPEVGNQLMIEDDSLVLKDEEQDELSSVPIVNDQDISDIVASLDNGIGM